MANKTFIIDMSFERLRDGSMRFEKRLPNGDMLRRRYLGYTKREALERFKKEYEQEVKELS